MQNVIQYQPRDLHKLDHVGVGQIEKMQFAKIPAYYYDFLVRRLPMSDADFDSLFGRNLTIFGAPGDDQGGTGVSALGTGSQTNATNAAGVNEPFLAVGTGIIAIGENLNFSMHGVRVDQPAAADTPAVLANPNTLNEGPFEGAADIFGEETTQRSATLQWGGPTWEFIDSFFNTYRLDIRVQRRIQVVDEALSEVGMVPQPSEFVGAGTSRVSGMPYINSVNERAGQLGTEFFLSPNVDNVATPAGCFPPPNPEATWGHPRISGLGNRMYCFTQPLLFLPGMRFDVQLTNIDAGCDFDLLRRLVTISQSTAGENFNVDVPGAPGCGESYHFPGGCLRLGVVMKGFSLTPQACLHYATTRALAGGSRVAAEMYGDNAYLMGLANRFGAKSKINELLGRPANAD